jgi:hypothetical protein
VRLHSDRTYRLVFSCPAANTNPCGGSLKVAAKVRRHTRSFGSMMFSIRSGHRATLKLRLSRKVKRLLRHHKSVTATITIRQIDAAGAVHRARLHVKIVLRR